MTPKRWQQLMDRWRAPESTPVLDELTSAYCEPHRHYHTGRHIDDCLSQLDQAAVPLRSPEEVELALWFHDAVYKTTSSTNELDSAEWAIRFLESIGAAAEQCARVHGHIMATSDTGERLSGDTAVVVDVDVSILGRDPAEYDIYEAAIRKEYRWVPGPLYRRKRIQILESFLSRKALYETEYFRERYEERARANLRRAIAQLRK